MIALLQNRQNIHLQTPRTGDATDAVKHLTFNKPTGFFLQVRPQTPLMEFVDKRLS